MAYTIDDFPFSTDNPQIEVTLPVGTHVLELMVEDSAGLRSLPDTVVVTVEREEVPDTSIDGIEPVSGRAGNTFNAMISGTGLADATAVTFYRQVIVTRPTVPTIPTPTRLNIPDTTITAEITGTSDAGVRVSISIDETAASGTRTFSVTTPNGVVYSRTMTFNVIRQLPTPTITIPTITIPTITIPTITIPTITIPTATITRPTATITRPTATVTIPTATFTRPTATVTIPTRPTATVTIPTRPTATVTIPTRPTATVTIPTRPTATVTIPTRPTATVTIPTRPTATIPTATFTRPTVTIATATTMTGPVVFRDSVMLTSVKGVGAATADKLTAAGIDSVASLASANAKDVAKVLGYQDITRAQTLVDEAKKLMG